jgi:hypothetical protein
LSARKGQDGGKIPRRRSVLQVAPRPGC